MRWNSFPEWRWFVVLSFWFDRDWKVLNPKPEPVVRRRKAMMKTFKPPALLMLVLILSVPRLSRAHENLSGVQKKKETTVQRIATKNTSQDCNEQNRDGAYWFNRGYQLHQSD